MTFLTILVLVVVVLVAWLFSRRPTRPCSPEVVPHDPSLDQLALEVATEPDTPIAFGYKMSWLAVAGEATEDVAALLNLSAVQKANWETGVRLAYADGQTVFVSPPVNGWTLVVSRGLPELGHEPDEARWNSMMSSLASRYPDVQYFSTHRVVDYHAWSRFLQGSENRAYAYLGERGETLIDRGGQTAQEISLGLRFFDERSPDADSDGYWDRDDLSFPDEEDVMNVAGRWSIDPQTLADLGLPPSTSLVGRLRAV